MTAMRSVPVKKVEDFIAEVVQNCEEVETKAVMLKVRIAKRSISYDSIMRELDEMIEIIRR